mmetsp:Transcript_1939/g.4459  ORF Transcript_1939/g.4459 Transcript_1939/m.4459 type:complete len:190 (-) Transcript_1939:322-891(-)|eukprot:CAMPEP_0113475532 /NCGR_PEP_ID=MMETSP0014_2-20120614/19171_1 /TAXON_ID=2857 /ORGANISM="Nitzschia sp." /LENGTH=189 /DNA_ID=CAMNT_0000368459 /DNA_START=45 /DNA_END=614 /DNA_ORIENTATION=+ /assembly_acc=CAM_ASM_000159
MTDNTNTDHTRRIGFENQTLDGVITELRRVFLDEDEDGTGAGRGIGAPQKALCIGRADYWLLEKGNESFCEVLQQGLIDSCSSSKSSSSSSSSQQRRRFRSIEFVFDSGDKDTPIRQDSKQERKFLKKQTQVRQKVHELALKIQEAFDEGDGSGSGSEQQTLVDGNTKQDILPTGDVIYKSTAIITFSL